MLRARFPHEPTPMLAAALGRSARSVSCRAYVLGLHKTDARRRAHLAAALNAGSPIGATRVDDDGYVRIKVREARPDEPKDRGWVRLHHYRWEQAHGPIPPGYALWFRDGNRQNCTLDNLELITRDELLRRAQARFRALPASLVETIRVLGRLKHEIRRRDGEKQDHRLA